MTIYQKLGLFLSASGFVSISISIFFDFKTAENDDTNHNCNETMKLCKDDIHFIVRFS